MSPARKYDDWLQSCLYFTKFQEPASRAVLGGTRYPLYYKNWVFLRDFQRALLSRKPPPPLNPPKWLFQRGCAGRGATARRRLRGENARTQGNCRTWMPQVVQLGGRVPKTFTFLAARVAYATELVLL